MRTYCKPMPIYFLIFIVLLASGAFAADDPAAFSVTVSGSGPDIIFIPGLASSAAVWDEAKARYAPAHRVHVLQVAGFAGAPAIRGPLIETIVSELADYITRESLHAPVIIGHSMGGVIGMRLAIEYPARIGGLVIVDSLPFLAAAFSPGASVEMVKPQAAMMRDGMLAAPREAFLANQKRNLPILVTGEAGLKTITEWAEMSDQATVANAFYELTITDLRQDIAAIRTPTLILAAWSPQSPFSKEQTTALYAGQYAALPAKKLAVIENSRHFIMLDAPDAFFSELDGFLDGE